MERTRDRPPDQLTAEETRKVLERASQLERRPASAEPLGLEYAEVERIGIESGLSREAIQRAFVELRMGSLQPAAAPGAVDRLLGPESVESRRLMPLSPEEARKKLHELLRAELLHPEERKGMRTTWSPSPGLWAAIQRGFNAHGQAAWQKGSIISEVTPAPPGLDAQSVVRLEGKPGNRTGYLVGAFVPGLSLLPIAGLAALSGGGLDAAAAGAMVGGFGVAFTFMGVMLSRWSYRKRLRELRLAIERVLEKLGGDPDDG